MAAAKRTLEDENSDSLKKFKSINSENPIKEFFEWCRNGNLVLSDKVSAQ